MQNQYIASIDQGTTSTRCILFDLEGKIVTSDQMEHRQFYPKPGWVEHNPMEILRNTQRVVQNALNKANLTAENILAMGITNQRETSIVWDRLTGQPYYPAIVWQDTRTDDICRQLAAKEGQDRYKSLTGLPLATYFSGPKIMWLLENIPDLRSHAQNGNAIFGTVDSWLLWNLTGGPDGGVHGTDPTNASRTMLMNLLTLDWDSDILASMNIPRQMLPRIMHSSGLLGYTKSWGHEISICADLGDQQAALCGQACFLPGEAKNTYGTGCFMLLNTGETPTASENGLLTTVAYKFENQNAVYALEGSIAMAGSLVQWLRDNLKMIHASSEIETLACSVDDNGGIYLVPAFSGLFAPYWRSDARGVIVGITSYVRAGHIARAVLEATAYQTREVLDAMETDSSVKLKNLKVDGGMVVNDLLMQFQADLLNVPVIRPEVIETTALGAAYAAGLAVGAWSGTQQLRKNWKLNKEWLPAMSTEKRRSLYTGWKKAVQRTLNWIE